MKIRLLIVCAICCLVFTGSADAREFVSALDGLTGGTSGKLDAVPVSTASGVSVVGSISVTRDVSGVTIYHHELTTSGGAENSPWKIVPDDAGAGATRWDLTAVSGATLWGKVLVIDTRTVNATRVDEWNTAYTWGDHSTVGYLTTETDADALAALALHTAAQAVSGTSIDWTSGITLPRLSGVTDAVQTQINTARGIADRADLGVTALEASKQGAGPNLSGVSSPGTWKVWYTNGSGLVTEVALGANGTYLKSTGAAAAPTFDTPASGGGGSGATRFRAPDGTDAEAGAVGDAPSGIFVIGKQGIGGTGAGNTLFITADQVHSMVSAFVHGLLASYLASGAVAGVSLAQVYALQSMVTTALNAASFTGTTGFALQTALAAVLAQLTAATNAGAFTGTTAFALQSLVNAVIAQLTQATTALTGVSGEMLATGSNAGASIWAGAQMSANQVAAGPQVSIVDAGAGVSVPFLVPYAFVMSGVTVEVNTAGENGVSIYWISGATTGQVQAIPSQFFAYVGGTGANQYNWTNEQYIPAMSKFAIRLPDVVAAGTSVWNIFMPGRKP